MIDDAFNFLTQTRSVGTKVGLTLKSTIELPILLTRKNYTIPSTLSQAFSMLDDGPNVKV